MKLRKYNGYHMLVALLLLGGIVGLFILPIVIGVIVMGGVLAFCALLNLLTDMARDSEQSMMYQYQQTELLSQLAYDLSEAKRKYELIDPDAPFRPKRVDDTQPINPQHPLEENPQ